MKSHQNLVQKIILDQWFPCSTDWNKLKMSNLHSPISPMGPMTPMGPLGSLQIKWDPKNLEIRTKSVEKTLEPLVTQVIGLIENFDSVI